MYFINYGIHTRLHYVVEKAGGIDKVVRRKMLKTKYGFDEETLDIVLMYNIEKLLDEHTIEEIKRLIIRKKTDDILKGGQALASLTYMLTRLCCKSDMFHLNTHY